MSKEERAALEKDAKRYRWLRKQSWFGKGLFVVNGEGRDCAKLGTDCPRMERLDSQIDAAMHYAAE